MVHISPKILFVSYAFYPNMGGIEVNSILLSHYFQKFGAEIKLVTMVEEEGEKRFPFPVIRKPGLQKLFELHKWADLVFENNPSLSLSWPKVFFKSLNVIAIRTRISREDGRRNIYDRLKSLNLRRACAVIAVSSVMKNIFFPNAVVIGNPYRENIFRNFHRERAPLSFVFVGRLVSEKGVDIAIEAIRKLSLKLSENNLPTLKIIGSGSELNALKELVKKYEMNQQVYFLGPKYDDHLSEILNSCRYILIPSHNEAFGNVAIEGMACGCLPFVSNNSGLPEAVGEAGVTFKVNSVDDLVEKIYHLINNPEVEVTYRQKFESHLLNHKPEHVARRYWDVIMGCIIKNRIEK